MKVNIRFVRSVAIFVVWLLSTVAVPTSTVFAASVSKVDYQTLSAGGADSDYDGLTDKQERACGTKPKVADSNGNGILDGADDQDRDGLSNSAEFIAGTKCKSKDTDRDGILDGQEVRQGTNPRKADGGDSGSGGGGSGSGSGSGGGGGAP